jgi:hypothetical protein
MISPRNNNNKRIQQMNPTNQPTMTTMTIPTTTKNPAAKSSILAGGPPSLAPLQPKTAPTPASGNPRHPQGMSATKANRKSGPPDGKTESGGENPAGTRPAPAAPPAPAIPAPDKIYWTCTFPENSQELRKAWALAPHEKPAPHARLTKLKFPTAKKLMAHLRTLGRSPQSVDDSGTRLATVTLTEHGFNVSLVPSYAAALQMDRTRKLYYEFVKIGPAYDAMLATMRPDPKPTAKRYAAKLTKLAKEAFAKVPDLKPCPFCRQSDLLEITGWTNQRPDESEYDGDAVNCHRCDCVVPLAAWQGATPAPTCSPS